MRGSRTPDAVRRKFKRKLLELGNAAAAARCCKIPVTTGQDLAQEFEKDPEFVRVRARLNAQALDVVESIMIAGVQRAGEMLQSGPRTPEKLAEMMADHGLKTFQDPRPQYLAQVVNAHRSLLARKKLAADQGAANTPARVILEFTDGTGSDGEAAEVSTEPTTEPGDKGAN